MKLLQNPSSFRDPSGHVYKYNNRIIRVIKKYGKKRYEFILTSYSDKNLQGLNAMSISDITGIPRATVVRKLKKLLKLKMLTINNKKHYNLSDTLIKKLMPLQETVLRRLANFSTTIFNLPKL